MYIHILGAGLPVAFMGPKQNGENGSPDDAITKIEVIRESFPSFWNPLSGSVPASSQWPCLEVCVHAHVRALGFNNSCNHKLVSEI